MSAPSSSLRATGDPERRDDEHPDVVAMVEHVAHLLPEQAPLHAFVHHNTLHAFEHLPFEEAVVQGAEVFGTEPFLDEETFAGHVATGRILPEDIDAVLARQGISDEPMFKGGPSERAFRRLRLLHPFPVPGPGALHWTLEETDVLRRFAASVPAARRQEMSRQGGGERACLEALFRDLHAGLNSLTPRMANRAPSARPRDRVVQHLSIDPDELVHPLLMRACAAYLDQGIAYWDMPGRQAGFLSAFRRLYGLPVDPPGRAFRGLAELLREHEDNLWNAEDTIRWALTELRVPQQHWEEAIQATLLSLRGWAGMMRRFELHPEQAPVEARAATLLDYLAVQLTLDTFATRHVLREQLGAQTSITVVDSLRDLEPSTLDRLESCALEAFLTAQFQPLDLSALANRDNAVLWLDAVQRFDGIERRKTYHLAYERRHGVQVLDAITYHERQTQASRPTVPTFQAVFCIDDREESYRRHLEELRPDCETYGFAGFFGVAMQYRGMDDIRPRPLCPVVIEPHHLIVEEPVDDEAGKQYLATRRGQGQLRRTLDVSSQTLVRGGLLTAALGWLWVIPLIGRCLSPRLAERLSRMVEPARNITPKTRLALERTSEEEVDGLVSGYSLPEMVDIVANSLTTMGLTSAFSPLVLIIGHGSTSLNNPHEAAYGCGATGGGCGGPNARAFSAMANDPRVRDALRTRNIDIPDQTWFVGAFHHTCDDTLTYYDEDLVPGVLSEVYRDIKHSLLEAGKRDAHERCRRFDTAPLSTTVEQAYAHVHGRAHDLGEPRPEYGHATNAVCIVGRRSRTRGLFLDRRAFLVSYDPDTDPDAEILRRLLLSVGPVGAGINLEYYFSRVDPVQYGCGTKLPHNVVGLFGVMDGHASDLRTGLTWQMVELHEPVRLLTIIEAEPETLERLVAQEPALATLVGNRWIRVVAWSPSSESMWVFEDGAFRPFVASPECPPVAKSSLEAYSGRRGHLPLAHIDMPAPASMDTAVNARPSIEARP